MSVIDAFYESKDSGFRGQAAPSRSRFAAAQLLHARDYGNSAAYQGGIWRAAMADHGELEYATAEGNDYAAHEQMYRNFVTLVKVGVVTVAIIVILMAYFLG